jgi:integrase
MRIIASTRAATWLDRREIRSVFPLPLSIAMAKAELSRRFVQSVICPPGRSKIDFFDAEQRGFMLEVRHSGGKTFYQRYTDARGRERQFKLGPADVITLDQARRLARTVLARAVLGEDPQLRRRELRATPAMSEFVRDRYLPHIKTYKRSWCTDETLLRIHILPAIGALAVDEVTNEAIADIMRTMRERGYASGTTNRILVLLRYIYNLGRKWKVPGMSVNPTLGLSTAPDVQRDRFLTADETQRLLAAIEADENRIAAWAITLLLLTGARRNEVTHAKWEYLNWDRRTLLVPLSKSGKPRTITLNAHALDLLRSVRRIDGNPYIFPSEITDKPCASLHFPWDRIRRRAGLVGVRLHDLRHSFASFLVNQGISLYVVQGLLGHSHSRTTQRYAHLAQQTLQNAAEVVGLIVSSGTQSAEVVPQSHNSSGALSRKMRPDLADTEANVTRNTACIDQPAQEISGDGREVKPAGPSEK